MSRKRNTSRTRPRRPKSPFAAARGKRIKAFFHSRFAVLGIVTVLIGALFLYSLGSLQLVGAERAVGQETKGISRQMKVEAPRGDILDVNGVPLAYSTTVNNIYVTYAGLDYSELNTVLLDLAHLFDEFGVGYGKAVDDYLDLETMTYAMSKEEMLDWQMNTNYLGLKRLPANQQESSKDTQFVKETPQVFFDYMSRTKFRISEDLPTADRYKIFRLRFQLYLNNWLFMQGEPILVATDVPAALAAIVSEQNYRYVGVIDGATPQRRYAENVRDVAHVVGYVGSISPEEYNELSSQGYSNRETVGKAGIESVAERYLHGTGGVAPYSVWTPKEEAQAPLSEPGGKKPVSGYDVQLTVRMDVQKAGMEALQEYIRSVEAREDSETSGYVAGTAVMINLKDGGSVVADVNYPTYNPQDFIDMAVDEEAAQRVETYLTDNDRKPMLNRAISQVYAPGSTFKAFVGVAAADAGIINRTTTYDCQRYLDVDGQQFQCTGRHGEIPIKDALAYSCNIYFYHAGMETGIDRLTEAFREFRLGEKTGIELPGEATGVRPSREVKAGLYTDPGDQQWFPADTAQISIGQGLNSYTVLQLARATGGIATGYLTRPYIIKQVTAQDGSVVYKTEADPIPLSFSQYSRDIVREGMRAAITDPHASAYSEFLDSPVAVAGKTGTAETNYGEGQIQTNGLFICFAPYDDPEIAVAVAAESGARGAGVSSVAAAMIKAYYSNPDADQQSVQPGLQ